jgi:hypothetical protein
MADPSRGAGTVNTDAAPPFVVFVPASHRHGPEVAKS